MIVTKKVNKMVIYKGHDASCPQEKLDNNMARAQFIVPLQHNYSQKVIIYYKIICKASYIICWKYFLAFWEITIIFKEVTFI